MRLIGMKICPNCHYENASNVNFCENCGAKLADASKQCPRCQYLNTSGNRFCENCGYDFGLGVTDKQGKSAARQSGHSQSVNQPQSAESTEPSMSQAVSQQRKVISTAPTDHNQRSTTTPAANQNQPATSTQPSMPKQSINQAPQSASQSQQPTSSSLGQPLPATATAQSAVASQSGANTASVENMAWQTKQPETMNHDKPTANQTVRSEGAVDYSAETKIAPTANQSEQEKQLDTTKLGSNPSQAQSTASSEANTRTNQSALRTPVRKTRWPWLIALLVIIVAVGGGAYFLYLRPSTTTTTKSPVTHKTATRHSSGATEKSQSTSQPATLSFDEAQIKDDISSTVGSINGTNSVYVSPVDSKQTVLVNNGSQQSASSIKIFIMVTAYAMAKEGVFNLDDTHTVSDSEKVGGTGVIQNMDAGTKLSYQEIIAHMIDDSDNTAANIMIEKLGGFQLINTKIKNMGATDTKLRRKMMDTKALDAGRDNTTSARDMGATLKKIYNHQLVSQQADDAMLTILSKNQNHNKLPKQVPSSATIYNKTGEYADYGVQNDAEVVKNSRGAFVAVVLSEDGEETDQVDAMNRLGLMLYQNILE